MMSKLRWGWLPRVLFFLCLPALAAAGVIEGRVVVDGQGVAELRVEAHASLDFAQKPLAISAPTDAEGRYRLELPTGLYSLFARDAKRNLFAFCGRNPVAVAEQPVWAGLQAVALDTPKSSPNPEGEGATIEGQVLLGGKPLTDAYVYLYLEAAEDLKGQGYRLSPPTGPDGFFAFDGLPESSFYLVARQRQSGGRVGPVLEGDALAVYSANPLLAQTGKTVRVILSAVRKTQESADSESLVRATGTALRGTVVDREGKPAVGVHIFVYTNPVIGHQRPAALSAPTGSDGSFTVHLREPGIYYVGARELYGDSPAPGERFGMYDETPDHGLAVKTGQIIEGLRIVVEPVSLD